MKTYQLNCFTKITTMKNKSVAILLATYNGSLFLKDQISSFLSQKDVNIDIYISDDDSSDATPDIINHFIKSHNNIHFVKQLRKKGAANNFYNLIDQINTNNYDYFALSDQDDIWPEHKLSRAIMKLNENSASGYSSDFLYFDKKFNFLYYKKSYPQKNYDFLFESPGPGCSFVMSRDLVESLQTFINGKQEIFKYHDWFIYAYARANSFKWFIDDSPNLLYRQHGSNVAGVNAGFKAYFKRIKRILFADWFNEIIYLIKLLNINGLSSKSKSSLFLFFFKNFYNTRRNSLHAFLMIPLFFIFAIQK